MYVGDPRLWAQRLLRPARYRGDSSRGLGQCSEDPMTEKTVGREATDVCALEPRFTEQGVQVYEMNDMEWWAGRDRDSTIGFTG